MDAPPAGWPGLCPDALAGWVWSGGGDQAICATGVQTAIAGGARHNEVARALRVLARAGLVLDEVAQAVLARWPGSADMAALAVDLAAPAQRGAALTALAERVDTAPERAAALARARRRHGDLQGARAALAASCWDRALRAALALEALAFEDAAHEITALGDAGAGLGARLVWLRDGATALAEQAKAQGRGTAAFWAALFGIWMSERDLARAQAALDAWSDLGCDAAALRRAELRLMLERGSAQGVRAALAADLDMTAPWRWEAPDHVLWLRSGLACEAPAADLARHAASAQRVFARHAGLLHLHLLCREAACDWRGLVPGAEPDALPERALMLARAELRMGLPGRALGRIAATLRRCGAGEAGARARLWALRVEALMRAGRPDAAAAVLERDRAPATPTQADLAALRAELALMRRAPVAALDALDPVMARFPARPPLWLLRARAEFARGDFAAAQTALARHAELTGRDAADDPRARLVADALNAGGPEPTVGQAAHLLVRRAVWPFAPGGDGVIPRQLIHYWEGPESPALARSRARWAELHPGFVQRVFDDARARDWLRARGLDGLAARFTALPGPALRADLFRLCIILHEGGMFADLDEYPRLPVSPWLERAECVLCIERGFGTVANNFIAAAPGQALIARALEHACAALDAATCPNPWWDTGPAQLARAVVAQLRGDAPPPGLRLLSQADYDRRVSTNLPWPHKRGAGHWRRAAPVDSAPGTA